MNPATASPVRDKNRGGGKSICMDRIIWVRTDLVEAVLANGGTLPAGWRPKKLRRYSPDSNQGHSRKSVASLGTAEKWESWGWCRARVCLSEQEVGMWLQVCGSKCVCAFERFSLFEPFIG